MSAENLLRLFKKLMEDTGPDYSTWTKVGTLRSQDVVRKRALKKDAGDCAGELEVLMAKVKAVQGRVDAMSMEWWDHLHRTYSLPRDGSFHITDDGSILIRPDNEECDHE